MLDFMFLKKKIFNFIKGKNPIFESETLKKFLRKKNYLVLNIAVLEMYGYY